MAWIAFKAWLIRLLGGPPPAPETEKLYFRQREYRLLVLDRPFDLSDWERLATLPQREEVFFEWLGHVIKALDEEAQGLKDTPDFDRARLVYLTRREAFLRVLNVGGEASGHIVQILNNAKRQEQSRGKGQRNFHESEAN